MKEFFQNLEEESGDLLPTWNGELYLELHRGTYTTQSRNKRANRKSEFLLHDAEFVASVAKLLAPDYDYPAEIINKAWEIVCLNQFHDIIPGSSINPVYVESQEQYAEVRDMGESVRDEALEAIGSTDGRRPARRQPDRLLPQRPGPSCPVSGTMACRLRTASAADSARRRRRLDRHRRTGPFQHHAAEGLHPPRPKPSPA